MRKMSIKAICSFCNKELKEPGALLFSPPSTPMAMCNSIGKNIKNSADCCEKFHICEKCFKKIIGDQNKK
jgi:hypothetical protein